MKLIVNAGYYEANSLVMLLWEVLKHRCWHLINHRRWIDNESEQVILITLSDKIKTETLKKIYNLLLDEELKSNDKETKNG